MNEEMKQLLEIINANYGSQQIIRLSYQKTDSSLFFDKKPHKEDIPCRRSQKGKTLR